MGEESGLGPLRRPPRPAGDLAPSTHACLEACWVLSVLLARSPHTIPLRWDEQRQGEKSWESILSVQWPAQSSRTKRGHYSDGRCGEGRFGF